MAHLTKVTPLTATDIATEQIGNAILNGDFAPGSQLPSEKDLMGMLGISRATLREALRSLERHGLIVRRHGIGTFVRAWPILKNLSLNYGLEDMISSAGYTPGYCYLDIREKRATEATAQSLMVDQGDAIVVVEMVRTADDRPVAYCVEMMPHAMLAEAAEDFRAAENPSLYDFCQTRLKMNIHHGIAKLSPVTADRELARHLKVDRGAPLLHHHQVDYLSDERPVILSRVYHRADAFEIVVYRARAPRNFLNRE